MPVGRASGRGEVERSLADLARPLVSSNRPWPTLVVRCDADTTYGSLVETIGLAYARGFTRLTLMKPNGEIFEPLSISLVAHVPDNEAWLPEAKAIGPDADWHNGYRPVLDLRPNGVVEYKGCVYYDPKVDSLDRLRITLETWEKQMTRFVHPETNTRLPLNPVMISTDEKTQFRQVEWLLELCHSLGIWRVHFAVDQW